MSESTKKTLSREELNEIVDTVWFTVLEQSVEPDVKSTIEHRDCLCASIDIEGEWQGAIVLKLSRDCLTHAAALIFKKQTDDIVEQDRVDTLTELTNMIGGTAKSLLPEVCNLSMPRLLNAQAVATLPQDADSSWSYFISEGHSLAVAVVEHSEAAHKVA